MSVRQEVLVASLKTHSYVSCHPLSVLLAKMQGCSKDHDIYRHAQKVRLL